MIGEYLPILLTLFVAVALIVNGVRGLKGHDVWWPPRTDIGPTRPVVDTGKNARRAGTAFVIAGVGFLILVGRVLYRLLQR